MKQRKGWMTMTAILEVTGLNKSYKDSTFSLEDVSLTIPYGSIVGFIGENGAGKSTTMGSILGTLRVDTGSIQMFERDVDHKNKAEKEDIGVVFDDLKLPKRLTVKKLNRVLNHVYKNWSEETFFYYVDFFQLPKDKAVGHFSRGMSMKLSVAVALSHEAKLLILDEATAGLDPTGRAELLEVLQAFVKDQDRGILMSSHITSDIEKIADQLVFIKGGKIRLSVSKQALLNEYVVARLRNEEVQQLTKTNIIAKKADGEYVEVLLTNRSEVSEDQLIQNRTIDDISLLLMRDDM